MKTKIKLTIGVGTLFIMIMLLAILGGWYINVLKNDIGNILKANYNSIDYSKNMLNCLEEISSNKTAMSQFESYLKQQQANVTEKSEASPTKQLVEHFKTLKENPADPEIASFIRKDLTTIMQVNMDAIGNKSNRAINSSEEATFAISIAGALCFMIAFVLLFNIPSSIANPISQLLNGIKEVSRNNYRERIYVNDRSEFKELAEAFNTMAEKLSAYSESNLEKILKSKNRIEALVENLKDPVFGVDENNRLIFVNSEGLKVSGLQIDKSLNKTITELSVENDLIRDIFSEPLDDSKKDKTLKIYADGKESYFKKEVINMQSIPTGEKISQHIGNVILLRNVTPYKELDLAKTNFVGTISHEFKTPIASIQLGVRLLENADIGQLNTEQKSLVEGIKEDSDKLLDITRQLLNISQVESGTIQLNVHQVAIRPMIDYAVNATHISAMQKRLKIEIDIDQVLEKVLADNEKTAWVITNLLSNAIRYSNEEGIIRIDVKKQDNMIRFSVLDSGPGIEPKYLDKLFDRYFRIPGSKKGGTGLGLSIAKEFIEAQGGKIAVDSEYGKGSCFYFDLKNA